MFARLMGTQIRGIAKVVEPKKPRKPSPAQDLSPQLSKLLNQTKLSRPEAMKAIWVYIKSNNTPKNAAGHFVCTGLLQEIIGKQAFSPPDVMKCLSRHMIKPVKIPESVATPV